MTLHHDHAHVYFNASRTDPTKTIVLRRRYERDLVRRFRKIEHEIAVGVGIEDKLVLNQPSSMPRFDFPRSNRKVAGFMRWLQKMVDEGILEVIEGTPLESAANRHWQNIYLKSAYAKGLEHAASELRKQGASISETYMDAAFLRPIHADRVGLIYTRVFNQLKGITDEMGREISRTLAQAIAEGRSPKQAARMLVDRVRKIGITRARMLARTEIIRAHAHATLNQLRELGVKGVTTKVEFQTARDEVVCEKCEELEGKVFTIDEAMGIIPVHPNCRCAWIPALDDELAALGIEI